jgi:1,4-dihydroxy-6-naphthoate synthase
VRRDVERAEELTEVLGESIDAGLRHRDEALRYARRFARDLDEATADEFVAMYVNDLTRDYGEVGRRAIDEVLRRAAVAR